ncbi:MAG TPA: cytochrome c family protein [Rickettsiales bacterium]|nr:cytochrome c family protein [Rickettsiales bacterium]
MKNNGLGCLLVQLGGAVVMAAVATVLVVEGANLFYGKEEEKGRGYKVDIAGTPAATMQVAGGAAAPAASDAKKEDIASYLQKADLALGARLIKRCETCHTFEKGKPNAVGPNQYGLVGRKVAAVAGYEYSDAMKARKGTWGFQELSDFITAPQEVVPGTKMGFAGLKKPEERAALLAYINKNFSDKPLPVPEK